MLLNVFLDIWECTWWQVCVSPTLPQHNEFYFRTLELVSKKWLTELLGKVKLNSLKKPNNCFGLYIVNLLPGETCSCCLVSQSYLALSDPLDCSTPGFPVLYYLPEFAQTHVHWVGDAIRPSHPLPPPSPPTLNLSQLQGLFQWVASLHQVAKVLELQLQHQSFQWIFRIDVL